MKNFALLFVCVLMGLSVSLSAQTEKKEVAKALDGPQMELETTLVDYGTIEQDSDPHRTFKFKNTGTEPLVIKHAKGSCGCTVPDYPKTPIMPGEESEIKVRYATNRVGAFKKTITLTTNEGDDAQGKKRILTISGKVLKAEEAPAAVPTSKPSIFAPGQ